MNCTKFGMAALLPLVFAFPAMAERVWPETSYDCQVKTSSDTRGLVTIQATSLEQARLSVVGEWAATTLGGRERAVSVTECIESGQDEFNDASFQAWKMSLDQ